MKLHINSLAIRLILSHRFFLRIFAFVVGCTILCLLLWHGTIVVVPLSALLLCLGVAVFYLLLPHRGKRHSTESQENTQPLILEDWIPTVSFHQDKQHSTESQENTQPLILENEKDVVLTQRLNNLAIRLEILFTLQREVIVAEERNRLARDLHDCIKQEFYALGAQIQIANEVYLQPQRVQKHLQEATFLLQNIQEEIKNLIQNLRPVMLKEKGLVAALQAYVTSWSRLCGIPTHFIYDSQSNQNAPPLPQEQEEAVFRVMQEALSNVARHSGAWSVEVHFSQTDLETALVISDNGRGFNPEYDKPGIGIFSMKERFQTFGGTVQINSTPGQGTIMVASLKHKASPQ